MFTFQSVGTQAIQGSCAVINEEKFGVFAMDNQLYFQWGHKRWNFQDLDSKIKYQHDYQRGVTRFSIESAVVEYQAWWVGDPIFDPNLPERDEEEDFLGYVSYLARDGNLRKNLIKSWS